MRAAHIAAAVRCLVVFLAVYAAPLTAAAADLAVITNQGSDSVSLVTVSDAGPVGPTHTVAVGRAPAGVAVDRAGRRAFVTNAEGRSVSVVDLTRAQVLAERRMGEGPVGIAYDPVLRRVYVADWFRNSLWVLDDVHLEAIAELPLGRAPAGVEVSADGTRVFVAERDDDAVAEIDARDLRVLRRHMVGSHPFGLRLTPDGSALWVTNVLSHDVSVIALADATVHSVAVGHRPYCIAFAAGRAFVTNQYGDSVSVIDAATLAPVATWAGIAYPEGIDAVGGAVWIVSWMDEEMVGLDARTLKVVGRVALARNPRGFGRFLLAE